MTSCAVCAHYAHDRPMTVHYVVHCLGSLFMETVHQHCSWALLKKKKYKNDPQGLVCGRRGPPRHEHVLLGEPKYRKM